MDRRLLVVLLAAAALAACQHDSPDREPVDRSPAPSMADAPPARFGEPAAPVPPQTVPPSRARPQEDPPPRPPADIPNAPASAAPSDARPGEDALGAGYDAARKKATGPRPAIGASARALLSAPLSQLLGSSGYGAHLSKVALRLKADDGSTFSLSAQSGPLGAETAYVVFYRDGLKAPAFVEIGKIKRDFLIFGAGGSVSEVAAEGRRLGVALHASASDGACAKTHSSEIEAWAAAHHDEAHTAKFTVSDLFARTADAGAPLAGANGRATLAVYKDIPYSSGKYSVAVFEDGGGMTPVPLDLLARPDGKLVSLPLHSAPAQRFGLRVTGQGDARALEVFDLSSGAPQPSVPLESLVPPDPCGR